MRAIDRLEDFAEHLALVSWVVAPGVVMNQSALGSLEEGFEERPSRSIGWG